MSSENRKYKWVGTRQIRPDGHDKVTGRAKFGSDFSVSGMIHGRVLRSPHAHAIIKSIDTSYAESLNGVKAIITSKDFKDQSPELKAAGEGMINYKDMTRNIMAREKALYDGHAVAAVAATTAEIAEAALELIKVDYEVLPHVIDVDEAMKDGAPILHEDMVPSGIAIDGPTNIAKFVEFMHKFGLITARDPKGIYHSMTDVIHKVLNDITVDDWAIIIGGDSHTRMSKGVAFGADSGTVALALATGEATMPIPESVKVTFKGKMADHMDFRDVVHATQAQMLDQFGDNVFQGRIIEVHIGTLLADQAFTFTDWTAEMKAKASICISEDKTLIESLEIAKHRIQVMIDKGMENEKGMLKGLINIADKRISEIKTGIKPALKPDENAKYYANVIVDLDEINELMIADPDVNNIDISKRYTHDTIRPISYYGADKKVDLGFVGSCMVHKGDVKIVAQMLRNLENKTGDVQFKAPLVLAAPTYNIIDELKEEGDWTILQKYSGFEFDDKSPKNSARTEYENILYLERPGCNLCMGNQEKAAKGDTVLATSTRLFKGRVVEDTPEKKGESLLASTPVVVLSAILGRTPTIEEYKIAVDGINLTKFSPPIDTPSGSKSVHF